MNELKLTFTLYKDIYGVCRLATDDPIPKWAYNSEMFSITKTKDELSIVCVKKNIPDDVEQERDWRVLKIKGPLDFSLLGILANVSNILAKEGISIFVVSTFETDYILVKDENIDKAVKALTLAGHIVK